MLRKECITWATLIMAHSSDVGSGITCNYIPAQQAVQFRNCHFVISGVLSPPTPNPHQNNSVNIIFIPGLLKVVQRCRELHAQQHK